MKKLLFILSLPLLSMNCGSNFKSNSDPLEPTQPSAQFTKYWYSGKAEVTSYKLYQARYGEMRQGTAVTIFVTEDFSAKKHVKLDNPAKAGDDAVSVLKLNLAKKFNTGIYPYSMLLSVFKPVNTTKWQHALKETVTSQEWCGNTFTQLDNKDDQYRVRLFSYFESDGDVDIQLPKVWLEDELWTQIRLNPELLPTGDIKIIPGFLQQRLLHLKMEAKSAVATLSNHAEAPDWLGKQDSLSSYTIKYNEPKRNLIIYFINTFPYSIIGWEETYSDPFGKKPIVLTTKAIKYKTLLLDYWSHHDNQDSGLRDTLGLDYNL